MEKPIYCYGSRVGLKQFKGTAAQNALVCEALTRFGQYLAHHGEGSYSYDDLADKIRKNAELTPATQQLYAGIKGLHKQTLAELSHGISQETSHG